MLSQEMHSEILCIGCRLILSRSKCVSARPLPTICTSIVYAGNYGSAEALDNGYEDVPCIRRRIIIIIITLLKRSLTLFLHSAYQVHFGRSQKHANKWLVVQWSDTMCVTSGIFDVQTCHAEQSYSKWKVLLEIVTGTQSQ